MQRVLGSIHLHLPDLCSTWQEALAVKTKRAPACSASSVAVRTGQKRGQRAGRWRTLRACCLRHAGGAGGKSVGSGPQQSFAPWMKLSRERCAAERLQQLGRKAGDGALSGQRRPPDVTSPSPPVRRRDSPHEVTGSLSVLSSCGGKTHFRRSVASSSGCEQRHTRCQASW